MSGNSSPPLIYMNMHAHNTDPETYGTPKWVWYMVFGVGVLAAFGLGLYFFLISAPL